MYRSTLPLAVYLLLLFSLLPSLPARAQAPYPLQLTFPTAGQHGVTVTPEITVVANMPIDPMSVTFNYPDAMMNGHEPAHPTVMVYPVGTEDADRVRQAARGTYSMPADNVVVFSPVGLRPGTEYAVRIEGLMTTGQTPSLLPMIESTFKTRYALPTVASCTLEGAAQISCADTVSLEFTAPVDAYLSQLAGALQLEATEPDAPGGMMPVPFEWTIVSGQNTVQLTPMGRWPIGAGLRLTLKMSTITGDIYDDRIYSTVVRRAMKVKVAVRDLNDKPVPDSIVDMFERYGQAMMAGSSSTMANIDRREDLWRFVEWEGPLVVSPSGDVTVPCELLRDEVTMTAIIEQMDTVRLVIGIDSGGFVDLYTRSGELLRTVSAYDTISITKEDLGLVCVARPDSGYAFTSWYAPSTNMHGTTAAAITMTGTNLGGLIGGGVINPYPPGFIPNFGPLGPTAEKYRLKATVVDEDNELDFDVEEGVVFETEREFEEDFPQFRTVCVRATDCWEITGYIVSATGEMEFFPGRERVCVRAELMDPTNSITFFARRITIMLRTERVMLETDNPNSVRLGDVPHPETYVRVEQRFTYANGDYGWRPLPDVLCEDNGIFFSRHAFKCGDVIRYRVKGADVRGQAWKFWDARVLYVLPSLSGTYGEERRYEMVIGKDIANFMHKDCRGAPVELREIRTRACFRQEFGIEAIGMTVRVMDGDDRSKARFVERWYDPLFYRHVDDDEPIGGRQIEYIPLHGTEIKVRFTSPVDVLTLLNGGLQIKSYNNTLVSDPTVGDLDFTVASSDDEHISFEPLDGSPITTVVFRANDPSTSPRMQALHGGHLDLTVFKSVRSLAGLPLVTNVSFILQSMELPGFGLQLRDILYKYDGDPDFWFFENDGEIYHVVYGGDLGADKIRLEDIAFSRIPDCSEQQGTTPGDCTLPHSDKDGPQGYGDKLLWMQPFWMDRLDRAWWHVVTYDEDCKDEPDCLVNKVDDILDVLREEVGAVRPDEEKGALDWGNLLPGIVRLGSQLIEALLPPDEQDQQIGQGSFLEDSQNLWGAKSSIAPYVILNESGTRYRLKARLFVNKAVIR